ncbi:MAG: LacI family DNA-binding transcriptional regulator [Jatrophihabitans sp.]
MSDPADSRGRPPTLQDVATRAGVSRALVSIVVRGVPGASEQTRARVLEVAAELGYRPDHRARLLAGRRSRLLGLTLSLTNPFHADLVEAAYPAAEALGYQVVLSAVTGSRTSRQAVDTLLDYRCDAALLLGPLLPPAGLSALAERLPVVVVGQPASAAAVDVVRAADAEGIRAAIGHLVELGHHRIDYVDGGRAPAAAERRAGYRAAMREHGLTADIRVVPGGQYEQDGAAAARQLSEQGLPEAVLTYNDRCAVGLLDVFARLAVAVPEQLSVVGYDDSQVARLPYLRITTVSQDATQLAQLAVGRAVDRIERPAGEYRRELVVRPQLVVRDTTARRA